VNAARDRKKVAHDHLNAAHDRKKVTLGHVKLALGRVERIHAGVSASLAREKGAPGRGDGTP
jgi:hypothetical protein